MTETSRSNANADRGFATEQLEYDLPDELIAQEALSDRSASRLLVVNRSSGLLEDATVRDLPTLLKAGDALVVNDTRVLPAKFALRRATGGVIDGLFVAEHAPGEWEVLLRGANRLRSGEELVFVADGVAPGVRIGEHCERGRWRIVLDEPVSAAEVLGNVGRMPLPPYIKRGKGADARDGLDRERYQTVYAARDGAVAAPTAGLHLTKTLLHDLAKGHVSTERVTLHVGYGTFAPVEVSDLVDHRMHSEHYELSGDIARRLKEVREAGGRVVAVGTTSARVLETTWKETGWGGPSSGSTGLFCYPPYVFGGMDALLTNFHLPRSTLLALVMAFAGIELTRCAYAHAVAKAYRFYSYGDAMLIL